MLTRTCHTNLAFRGVLLVLSITSLIMSIHVHRCLAQTNAEQSSTDAVIPKRSTQAGADANNLQSQGASDLQKLLCEVVNKRREYVEVFKDLMAQETKLTELFDKHGRLQQRREVVADLLVYQSRAAKGAVNEYRVTREVDGKLIPDYIAQVENLLHQLAEAKTLEDEQKLLRKENMRYTLHYYRWDVTVNLMEPFAAAAEQNYSYELQGPAKIGSRISSS